MPHLILLGDSIFDNASYVPGQSPVIEQARELLPAGWRASLLAFDGHRIGNISSQLARLPADSSHLVISVGGNDALGASWILGQPVDSVSGALTILEGARGTFRDAYARMLERLVATELSVVVCTIYDRVPGLGPGELAALAGFNEIILREAFASRVSVIDLRLVCSNASDYSRLSPIEPSAAGGLKISRVVANWATASELVREGSMVYW